MRGLVFNVQRYSTHDGPGIRTVLFLKGCSLRCPWCENPESQEAHTELMYNPELCLDCGACFESSVGPRARRKAELCPTLALRRVGREVEAGQIVDELLRDEAFFRSSGGGVTFSGGECLAQASFLREVMLALRDRGVDLAVETCLVVPRATVERFLDLPILWLPDLKHADPGIFRAVTGGDLDLILGNLGAIAASGAELRVRVPVVPGFNADDENLGAIMAIAADLPNPALRRRRLDLLPYHELAVGKYAQLGRRYPWPRGLAADKALLARSVRAGAALGLDVSIGG